MYIFYIFIVGFILLVCIAIYFKSKFITEPFQLTALQNPITIADMATSVMNDSSSPNWFKFNLAGIYKFEELENNLFYSTKYNKFVTEIKNFNANSIIAEYNNNEIIIKQPNTYMVTINLNRFNYDNQQSILFKLSLYDQNNKELGYEVSTSGNRDAHLYLSLSCIINSNVTKLRAKLNGYLDSDMSPTAIPTTTEKNTFISVFIYSL
jgi:hypothetical protein